MSFFDDELPAGYQDADLELRELEAEGNRRAREARRARAGVSAGDRVELIAFGRPDPYTRLQPGAQGTVTFIDDAGTVHVRWDDGSYLGLIQNPMPGPNYPFRPDQFRRLA